MSDGDCWLVNDDGNRIIKPTLPILSVSVILQYELKKSLHSSSDRPWKNREKERRCLRRRFPNRNWGENRGYQTVYSYATNHKCEYHQAIFSLAHFRKALKAALEPCFKLISTN